MYEIELNFLDKHIDLIEQDKWEELYEEARYNNLDWTNICNICLDPDVDLDIFKGLSNVPDAYCLVTDNLTTLKLYPGIKQIGLNAFRSCAKLEGTITIPNGVVRCEKKAFAGCPLITKVEMPDTLKYIGDETFYNCTSLSEVNLSHSLLDLPYGLFSGCSSLEKIIIPASVEFIEWNCFLDCTKLKEVVFEKDSHLCDIDEAFSGCNNLTSLTLPESMPSLKYIPESVTQLTILGKRTQLNPQGSFYNADLVIRCSKDSAAALDASDLDLKVQYI